MSTRDALDTLMVAHDASLEGRDASGVLSNAPLWARHDRLLGQDVFGSLLDQLHARMRYAFGPTLDLSENTLVGMVAKMQAEAIVVQYNILEKIQQQLWAEPDLATTWGPSPLSGIGALIIDGDY